MAKHILNELSERIESWRQVKQLSITTLGACAGIADKTRRRRIADPSLLECLLCCPEYLNLVDSESAA